MGENIMQCSGIVHSFMKIYWQNVGPATCELFLPNRRWKVTKLAGTISTGSAGAGDEFRTKEKK